MLISDSLFLVMEESCGAQVDESLLQVYLIQLILLSEVVVKLFDLIW